MAFGDYSLVDTSSLDIYNPDTSNVTDYSSLSTTSNSGGSDWWGGTLNVLGQGASSLLSGIGQGLASIWSGKQGSSTAPTLQSPANSITGNQQIDSILGSALGIFLTQTATGQKLVQEGQTQTVNSWAAKILPWALGIGAIIIVYLLLRRRR